MSEQTTASAVMVNFTIDGIAVSVPKGTTVYKAAKQLGIEIPIFCYQDRMPPFGACRMCLVEVEKMPKLQTSCTLEATEGMVVKTQSGMAVDGRKGILEFLLINHPLDCPICDKGGECPLQDNTMQFGPGASRFHEDKRRFKKAYPLGPVLELDRERCIICARCTRFGENIAGDNALEFIERGYRTEVGTPDGGPAKSKFIGNTIMICPVGALTSRVYRFRARPWDNTHTKSTCTLCPVGCSLTLDSRDGEIVRTRSTENGDVNDIWLCDKGWFGYEFTYNTERLTTPLIRRNGNLEPASWDEALTLIADKIREAKSSGNIGALGGNPLTVEENYLFQQLMREVVGVNNLDHRIETALFDDKEEGIPAGMEMSIGECEKLSFAILLGLDLTEEFPVIWLRLRQAINHQAKTLFIGHFAPEIDTHLNETILHTPGEELEALKKYLPQITDLISKGGKGAIFVGRQYLSNPNRKAILAELLKLRQSSPNLSLNIMEGRGNGFGARYAGMRPDAWPLNKQVSRTGLNTLQMLEKAAKSGWDVLYVAGANPAKKLQSKLWKEAKEKLKFLVVQDLFLSETAQQADVVLPALSYVEKGGCFINIEGRVQLLAPGKDIPENIYSDAEIFTLIAQKLSFNLSFSQEFAESLKPGVRLPLTRPQKIEANPPVTSSGTLFASFSPALFDNGVRMKHNPHVIQLAQEPFIRIHPSEGEKRGLKTGDNIQLSANGNSISAKVKLDRKVALKTAVIPLGFDAIPVNELATPLLNGIAIEIKKVV